MLYVIEILPRNAARWTTDGPQEIRETPDGSEIVANGEGTRYPTEAAAFAVGEEIVEKFGAEGYNLAVCEYTG